jgi:hypothetical protein
MTATVTAILKRRKVGQRNLLKQKGNVAGEVLGFATVVEI